MVATGATIHDEGEDPLGVVVILLSFDGFPPGDTMIARGIATAIGSALALTGSDLVEPVIDAANAFADALQEADQRLSPEAVAALMLDKRKGGGDGLTDRR